MPPSVPLGNVEVDVFLDECGEHPAMALFRVQLEATQDRVRCPLLDLLKVEPQGGRRGKPGFQVLPVRRLPVHGLRVGRGETLGARPVPVPMPLGDTNFSFIAGGVKFVCLNTNAMEYDYSEPIPDFDYIERQLTERADEFNKTVFCMHARPLCDQFNNNVAKVFQMYVRQFPGLQFCTVAHEHRISASDVFDDGVMYYGSNCMKNRSYLVFTIKPDGYDYEVVEF